MVALDDKAQCGAAVNVRSDRTANGRVGSTTAAAPYGVALRLSGSGATASDHDLAITEPPSKLGDAACERRLNTPHNAVIPPSTNSRAPVT